MLLAAPRTDEVRFDHLARLALSQSSRAAAYANTVAWDEPGAPPDHGSDTMVHFGRARNAVRHAEAAVKLLDKAIGFGESVGDEAVPYAWDAAEWIKQGAALIKPFADQPGPGWDAPGLESALDSAAQMFLNASTLIIQAEQASN